MSINNNAFIHGLTNNTESGGIKPGTVRHNNKGKNATYFCDNNNNNNNPPNLLKFAVNINLNKLVNIKNLTVNIYFLDYHFNDNGYDYKCLIISPFTYFLLWSVTALQLLYLPKPLYFWF